MFLMLETQYEEDFVSLSERLTALIEPVLMIVMGLLVGFIALAIITPVYQITQDFHG
jgi:type II secretory pathway component PulF